MDKKYTFYRAVYSPGEIDTAEIFKVQTDFPLKNEWIGEKEKTFESLDFDEVKIELMKIAEYDLTLLKGWQRTIERGLNRIEEIEENNFE